MANELTVNLSVSSRDTISPYAEGYNLSSKSDQLFANKEYDDSYAWLVTVAELNFTPQLTAPGLITFQNLDLNNFVTYGADNASAILKVGTIPPGGFAAIYLAAGAVLRFSADTADVTVRVVEHEA